MGAIGGICHWCGQPLDPQILARMGQQMLWMGPDKLDSVFDRQAGLLQRALVAAPRQQTEGPAHCAETGCMAVADARIDNREELIAALDLRPFAHPLSDTALILASYLRWQEKTPEKIIGDFAFAVWDPQQGHFFCARDRLGVRPLYYLHQDDQFACASHPAPLLSLPGVSSRRNEQRLACYLAQILPEDTATFYEAIHRLPPGFSLKASTKGVAIRQYWSPMDVRTITSIDEGEAVSTFRTLFTEAVRCRLSNVSGVGSTLSGGLDSSSITCLASALLKQDSGGRLHTFSAIFPSLPPASLVRIDEREFMVEVRQHCQPHAHEIRADKLHPFATLADDIKSAGQPFFGPNMYIHNGMYESAARLGVKVFLDGTDGDSVVSYGFERFPYLLLTGRWLALMRELSDFKSVSGSRQPVLRLAGSYAAKPVLAAINDRLGLNGIMPENPQKELLAILHPDFKKRVDIPGLLEGHRRRMRLPFSDPCANHRASLALPFLSHILEISAFFSARYAIETRYPFLDHRLVEFCLSLPSEHKLSHGWSRAVQRKAMSGLVPERILQRIFKADLSPNYYNVVSIHGFRIFGNTLLPSVSRLTEYVDIDRLLPRLKACLSAPEKNKDDALLFFTATCVALWLESSDA